MKKEQFIEKCKEIVRKLNKGNQNPLGYLRAEDESLKDALFFSDGILNIWFSEDEDSLYVRANYPEPALLIHLNRKKGIHIINEDIQYQFSHVNVLLGDGDVSVFVCPRCGKGHLSKEWDNSTLEPLKGRTIRGYDSVLISKQEYTWPYICPSCKEESYKKDLSVETRKVENKEWGNVE